MKPLELLILLDLEHWDHRVQKDKAGKPCIICWPPEDPGPAKEDYAAAFAADPPPPAPAPVLRAVKPETGKDRWTCHGCDRDFRSLYHLTIHQKHSKQCKPLLEAELDQLQAAVRGIDKAEV